ncbi:MAG: hypothetical protein GWP19_08095 [Planctomycetia bacterium]|nr:hypothetical protein [Planctomycetia bacterium]
MLVIKYIKHPHHSQHWSELKDGTIHITSYCPDTLSEPVVIDIKRKYASKLLRTSLKEGWIIMVNNLFTQKEL